MYLSRIDRTMAKAGAYCEGAWLGDVSRGAPGSMSIRNKLKDCSFKGSVEYPIAAFGCKNDRWRTWMRKQIIAALAAAAVASGVMTTAALSQGLTLQQEAADCQGDAMRFCSPYIPDRAKIHNCLVTYRAYLSPACRSIIAPAKRRKHS
jgi:hypothetical protein